MPASMARSTDPLDAIDTNEPIEMPRAPARPAPEVVPLPRGPAPAGDDGSYSMLEVANHLQINPDTLRSLTSRFGAYLAADVAGESPRYSSGDVAVLLTVRTLLAQGQTDPQIQASLAPRRMTPPPQPALHAAAANALNTAMTLASQWGQGEATEGGGAVSHVVGDVLSALASGQQTVLNSQASMREMVSVVVQDNFNLKDENRKLRERMLELERALAEYQRREETRKERYEARFRALEGTLAALQQQMAQFVHLQRAAQQKKRGWW